MYDANANINSDFSTTTTKLIRFPISKNFMNSFEILETKLNNIDINDLNTKITLSGLDLSNNDLKNKITKIIQNLNNIKNYYKENSVKETVDHNKFKPIDNILNIFFKNLNEIDPSALLIQHNNEKLLRCEMYLENCKFYNILEEDLLDLLEGELKIDNVNYQYIGKDIDLDSLNSKINEKFKIYKDIKIFYEEGINIDINEEKNTIKIDQNKIGSRVYISNGKLENISIIFNGFRISENKISDTFKPPNYPINQRGLTGCISFINIYFDNIDLTANNSNCEDAINLINTSGKINTIFVQNSFSDALDADFSELRINNLKISSANNDCADFSAGKYELIKLDLNNCGDKGVSIGEKSNVKISNINANNVDVGIATKDSSTLSLKNASFQNLRTCISAYNKKQEFHGGFIKVENFNCKKFTNKFEIDKVSKIIFKDNILTSKK